MLTLHQTKSLHSLWRTLSQSWQRLNVPLLGSIAAGRAEPQEARQEGCLTVDAELMRLPKNARTFALEVRGDSMTGAGILAGDMVVMEFREARHGDIVAALIDGETTLKRYLVHEGVPYLRASNRKYPDLIPAQELVIQGVMVALLRLPQR